MEISIAKNFDFDARSARLDETGVQTSAELRTLRQEASKVLEGLIFLLDKCR